jgi:pantothenate kinase
VERARALAGVGGRRVLGIAGAPGGGKSTLAEALVQALGPDTARLVGMDGFHLAQAELERLGRADRKGAPDTFDAAGYVALLRRLRASEDAVVYAPEFRRAIEEPVACAVPVPREVPLVVTEGNYLLVPVGDWAGVRALLDEAWFVAGDEDRRRELLIARHIEFGKAPDFAREWVLRSDERNAELVASTRGQADLVVPID